MLDRPAEVVDGGVTHQVAGDRSRPTFPWLVVERLDFLDRDRAEPVHAPQVVDSVHAMILTDRCAGPERLRPPKILQRIGRPAVPARPTNQP